MKEAKEKVVELRGRALAQHRMALLETFPRVLEGQLTLVSRKRGIFVYLNPKTGDLEAMSIKIDR